MTFCFSINNICIWILGLKKKKKKIMMGFIFQSKKAYEQEIQVSLGSI